MIPFSVLMSVYFREKPDYLRQSLDSVFGQTLLPNEVVLVEDGPLTPELNEVIDTYQAAHPELKVVPLEKNGGLGNALNEGIKHCTYDVIARMDTDDICKPWRFERQMAFLEEHPEVDICSSWIDEFEDSPTNIITQRRLPEQHDDIVKYAKKRCPINHPTTVYRKAKVLAAGGYGAFPEDYYLWVRMIMTGCRFYNLQESLLWFRYSSEVTRRRGGWSYTRSEIRAQVNIYKTGFLSFPQFATNLTIRIIVRLMPLPIRNYIYQNLLRKKQN